MLGHTRQVWRCSSSVTQALPKSRHHEILFYSVRQLHWKSSLKSQNSKVPIYFQNTTDNHSTLDSRVTKAVPTYFPKTAPTPGPLQTWSPQHYCVKWSFYIALLIISGVGISSYRNSEDVPIVNRRRYWFWANEKEATVTFAGELVTPMDSKLLKKNGLPCWEDISKSALVLKPDGSDDKTRTTHSLFAKLLKDNGLERLGIHLVIFDKQTEEHVKQACSTYIFMTNGIFRFHPNPESISAHLARLLAPAILNHKKELINEVKAMATLAVSAFLFIPATISVPMARLVTIPFFALYAWKVIDILGPKHDSLENEAEDLAVRLLSKSGTNPKALVSYHEDEIARMQSELRQIRKLEKGFSADVAKTIAWFPAIIEKDIRQEQRRKRYAAKWVEKLDESTKTQEGIDSQDTKK